MKHLSIIIALTLSACGPMIQGNDPTTETPDANVPAVSTVTIGKATCTPSTRDNIGVSAAPGTAWQLYLDDTGQAYDCTGPTPPCWCLGGGPFPLDTYDCSNLAQAER